MHRSLVFLALLVAGIGAQVSAPIPHEKDGPERHQLASAAVVETAAALRAIAPVGAPMWLEGSAPSPRGVPRRSERALLQLEATRLDSTGSAMFLARLSDSSDYLSALALARAGRLAFQTTAPPPFRFV